MNRNRSLEVFKQASRSLISEQQEASKYSVPRLSQKPSTNIEGPLREKEGDEPGQKQPPRKKGENA